MSDRTLKQLVGALVVVAGLWLVATLFAGGGGGAIAASGDIVTFFDGVDEESTDAVRLTGGDEPIELRREGDAWTVNGFASDSNNVARFWSVLSQMEVGGLAATNPANHERMGVADGGHALEIDVGGATRTILVGEQGARYGTLYGRLPGEDEVYLLEGDLRLHVIRRLSDWRNKRMAAVDSTAVHRLEVERDGDAYALVRGDSAWTLEGGGEAEATPVRGILSELYSLRASDFLSESDSIGALPPGGSTVAYSESGDVLARITFGAGEGDVWARAEGDDVLYRLGSFRIDRLAPERERVEGTEGGDG